jgi:hypothetical protein
MTLEQACAILGRHRHCDAAEWCVAYDGTGPHAWGTTPGRRPDVRLSREDAVRLAAEYEAGRSEGT